MKRIGDRVSIKENGNTSTIVISTKIPSWQETLLAAWLFCWTICGAVFIWQLFEAETREQALMIGVMCVFWAYYEVRVVKAFMWRKFGMEFIKLDQDNLTYKRSVRGYGKAHIYFIDNIKNLGVINKSDKSFFKSLEESFWVIGGERIGFDYLKKSVQLGMQLEEQDSKKLSSYIEKKVASRIKDREE